MIIITKNKTNLIINNENLINIKHGEYHINLYFKSHYDYIQTSYPKELKDMILSTLRGDLKYIICCDENDIFYIYMFEQYIKIINYYKCKL